ncbi:MAG: PHP domain-containing protein [Thermoleophilia bacterium]|nr:PHP domain-containing protein [Thermoleophilia bacterium]
MAVEPATHQQRILLASPYAWTTPHPVNDHIADLADGLMALREAGEAAPQPIVIAPSADAHARRSTRFAMRQLVRGIPAETVFAMEDLAAAAAGERRPQEPAHDWPLLSMPLRSGPVGVSLRAAIRVLMEQGGFELVHVHDPLESDLVRFLVRTWSGLSVATVHDEPAEGGATRSTAPHRERLVDGIDRWLVPTQEARQQIGDIAGSPDADSFVVPTGAAGHGATGASTGPVIVVGRGGEDDAIVRGLVRDLQPLLDARPELSVTFLSRWAAHHRPAVPRPVRGRVRFIDARTREQANSVLAGAGAYLALPATRTRSRQEATAARVPIVDVPAPGDVDAGDVEALHLRITAALEQRCEAPAAIEATDLARAHVIEYDEVREKIQVHIPHPAASDRSCVIDLHMHTSHSWDCATDPEALLHVAREVGLTAIAVTDHNEISGALEAARYADEYGIQVIVGEEVMTAQGEVIGLFLTERIEPGLSWHETIARIRAQDGLVYVPHPFDRLHTIPDVHLLRDTLDDIDAFEVYNARLPFDQYNRDAERFARKYNLVEGAGSDAHVTQGLGTAAVHMPAWDDKESFLLALGQGEILKRPKSLLYLQGLKWANDWSGRSKVMPEEAVGERYRASDAKVDA